LRWDWLRTKDSGEERERKQRVRTPTVTSVAAENVGVDADGNAPLLVQLLGNFESFIR
jgi:hypothetical protein